MKFKDKLLYFAIPVLMIVFSCSKKNNPVEQPTVNQKLFNVNFNVSGFTSSVSPLSSSKSSVINQTADQASTQLSDVLYRLHYLVYNPNGVLVKDTVQNKSASDFGTMNLLLPVGDYKLVVVGMDRVHDVLNKNIITNVYAARLQQSQLGDLFKQIADFKVTNQATNQSVALDRIVGKVGVTFTDAIPKGLSRMTMTFTTGSLVYLNNSNNPQTEVYTGSYYFKPADEGLLNFSYSSFVIPLNSGSITTDVMIRGYNASETIIAEKFIKNVVIEKNKMTMLSGALFSSLPSNSTSVTVNSDWKPSSIITF